MIKKLLISTLTCLLITNVSASTLNAKAPQISIGEETPWTIATQEDGYFQLLGLYDNKKFIVQVASFHNGMPSDTLTLHCNAGNGYIERHEVPAGTKLTCYPHFHDVIDIYVDPTHFKNGAEGNFSFEPYTPKAVQK